MEDRIKRAIVFFAATQIMIELTDQMKGSTMYNFKAQKNLVKCQAYNEEVIEKLFKTFGGNEEYERYFNKSVSFVETILKSINNNDIDDVIALIEAFESGNVKVVADDEH